MGFIDRVISTLKKKQDCAPPAVMPGRNDPCWCGSGRKYKKCHLPEEQQKAAEKGCNLNCGPT